MPSKKHIDNMKLLSSTEDYNKCNLLKGSPAIWEDGMRTHGGRGTYEWWYVDTEFSNGMVIVVTFFAKNGADAVGPAHPRAQISITFPDGRKEKRDVYEKKGQVINASREYCDVKICNTSLKFIDGDYHLVYQDGDLNLQLLMKSTLPMYRPETGHLMFGDSMAEYMGWFVAQPSSVVTGSITIGNETQELVGRGYHDHNWGAGSMLKQFDHWYWGRATIGGYTFITVNMVSTEKYENSVVNIFMLGKDGKIIDNDLSKATTDRADNYQHEFTKKFMDNHLTFTQPMDDGVTYKIEYFREKDIDAFSLLEGTKMPRVIQKIVRATVANPTYVRSIGKVRLTINSNGIETIVEDEGLWEQMSLGKSKVAKI